MFDRKNGFHPKTILYLLAISTLGFVACSLIRYYFGFDDLGETPKILLFIQWLFAFVWCFTLIVIYPLQMFYFRRKNRDNDSLGQ